MVLPFLLIYPFVAYLSDGVLRYVSPYLLLAMIAMLVGYLFWVLFPVSRLWRRGAEQLATLRAWLPRVAGGTIGLLIGLLAFGNLLIGRTGALMGNTAEQVLDRATCSVLTMKPHDFISPVTLPDETTEARP